MVEKQIESLIKDVIESNGYLLDSVEFSKNTLTIVIDKEGLVDVEDCVKVTNLVNPILDEKDLIKTSYVLDVCSKEKGSI